MQPKVFISIRLLLSLFLFYQVNYALAQARDIYSTAVTDEVSLLNTAFQREIDSLHELGKYRQAVQAQLLFSNFKDSIARQEKIEAIEGLQSELKAKAKENELAIANAFCRDHK